MFCFGGGWEGRQEDQIVYEWTQERDYPLTEGPWAIPDFTTVDVILPFCAPPCSYIYMGTQSSFILAVFFKDNLI